MLWVCLDWVPNRGACIDACLSGDVTRSFRLHDESTSFESFDMRSTITVVKLIKHAETSVKNDASGDVYLEPESTQS